MKREPTEQISFVPLVFAEMLAACRVLNGGFTVTVSAASSEYAPESIEMHLQVIHYGTGNEKAWAISEGDWQGAVRQAKRTLAEWHETDRSEPKPGCGVQGMW